MSLKNLIEDESWQIIQTKQGYFVRTQYTEQYGLLKLKHPALLHLELYKNHTDPDLKFQHLKKAHDYLWPKTEWHYWTERRFRTHCEPWNYITLAAGASASKSYDIAKLAILFWYANPQERNVTIASVTLSSLMTRVWGYVTSHIRQMAIDLPYKYYRSQPPKILFEEPVQGKNKIDDDTLHGIFAVTAQKGDDDQAVATWIGKHPKERILLILDEATDMPLSILNALPNLNSHPDKFQLIAIGNSDSTMDLHGLLSTPKNGWESISPELIQWDTTQPRGTCLYFSPYESPAIHDEDPVRQEKLSKFLIGKKTLEDKEKELGTDTEQFYRWVLGFWKSKNTENVTASIGFLQDFDPRGKVEWSGYYPLQRIAGLDPAFSTGGDKCILRIATVGHCLDTKVKIDFSRGNLLFEIPLKAIMDKSIEKQLAEKVVELLAQYRVPLDNLAIDVTGQGRAIGEVIKLVNKDKGYPLGFGNPLKVYAMSQHNVNKTKKSAPDILPVSTHTLWNTMREYIEQGQVCGLDDLTITQLTNRLIMPGPNGSKKLEPKRDYKRRMAAIGHGHSPDEADATALCFQVLLHRMGVGAGTTWANPTTNQENRYRQEMALAGLDRSGITAPSQSVRTIDHPVSDFSGGLDAYLKYTKPF